MDEMLPPSEEGQDEEINNGDISLPEGSPEGETESEIKDETVETEDEDKKESKKEKVKEDTQDDEEDEEIDLEELLSELADNEDSLKKSDEAIANIEKDGTASADDITILKAENANLAESLKRMEVQLKKTMADKTDLVFKNAELEAFGGESTDPQMLMLSRNMEKAKAGDDKAKSKCVQILKEQLDALTGEDYDSSKTEKKVDLLSAAESYNNASNPNIKDKKSEDDDMFSM